MTFFVKQILVILVTVKTKSPRDKTPGQDILYSIYSLGTFGLWRNLKPLNYFREIGKEKSSFKAGFLLLPFSQD